MLRLVVLVDETMKNIPSGISEEAESPEEDSLMTRTRARIAVYDDFLSAPRIVDVDPAPIAQFIEAIASQTYELAQKAGGTVPYTVIREITENFIHAHFKECTVSILEKGSTIRFSDRGPGITKKDLVLKPGFTSATEEMRHFIRGVGSGFPIVREYLNYSQGSLSIEDNIDTGCVITVTVNQTPQVAEVTEDRVDDSVFEIIQTLEQREKDALLFLLEEGIAGPTELSRSLNTSVATAHRVLEKLEQAGLVEQHRSSRKRILSNQGFILTQNL